MQMTGPSLNQISPSEIVPRPADGSGTNGEDGKLNEPREVVSAEYVDMVPVNGPAKDGEVAIPLKGQEADKEKVDTPRVFHRGLTIMLAVATIFVLVFPPFEYFNDSSNEGVGWSMDGSFGKSRWFTNKTMIDGANSDPIKQNNLPHYIEVNSILVMLTALVVISIAFELGHHYLHHITSPNFHPVLKALNGELMGLGFIAIVFYVIEVRAMVLTSWSVNTICAQCDPCQGWDSNDPSYHMDNTDGLSRRLGGVAPLVGVVCNVNLCRTTHNMSKNLPFNTTEHGPDSWLHKPASDYEYAKGDANKWTQCDIFHTASRQLLTEWDQESPGWLEQRGGLQKHNSYDLLMQIPFPGGKREQMIHAASLAAGLHGDTEKVKAHMLKSQQQWQPRHETNTETNTVPHWARAAWAEHRRLGGGSTGGCYHCEQKLMHKFEDIHMMVFLTMILYFIRAAFLIQQVQEQQKRWRNLEANLSYSETHGGGGEFQADHGSAAEHEMAQEWYSLMQGTWKLPEVLSRQSHIGGFSGMMKSLKRGGAVGLISDMASTASTNLRRMSAAGGADGADKQNRANDAASSNKNEEEDNYQALFETGTAPKKPSILRWLNPFWAMQVWRARESLEYALVRRRFINGLRKNGSIDKAELRHFDFAEYLSIVLGNTTAHIVHIPWRAWFLMEVAFVCFYFVTVLETKYRMRAYFLALCILFAFMVVVLAKIYTIRDALLPKIPAWWQSNRGNAYHVDSEFITNAETSAADPSYVSAPRAGKSKNPHAKLFWGGNMHPLILGGHEPGPEVITYICRLCNLLCIIWACLLIYAGPYTAENDKKFQPFLGLAFFVILGVMWTFTPEVLRLLTVVESIELMKKPGIIDMTIREMKTKRTMNTMILLRAICMVVRQSRGMLIKDGESPETGSEDVVECRNEPPEKVDDQESKFLHVYHGLDEDEKARCDQLKEFFTMFDKSGDGEIDLSELDGLMRSLGVNCTKDDSKLLMSQFDKSGDGAISFPEFYAYMKGRMDTKNEDTSQIVADIFAIIDVDGNGTITVDEFSTVLLALPIDISKDDIEGLVQEMDVSGEGIISLQEFAAVLDEHKQ